jgi:DNA-binding CsgD family transcriptional regulator
MSGKRQVELTEGQKECLRLVAAHFTSKEIARSLNISRFTVDQRLDAARSKLSASSRKEAALMFVSADSVSLSHPLVYEPNRVESQPGNTIPQLSVGSVGIQNSENIYANYLSIENTSFADRSLLDKILAVISVPPVGGQRHELSTREVFVQSLNVAFYSAVIIGIIVIVIAGTMRVIH